MYISICYIRYSRFKANPCAFEVESEDNEGGSGTVDTSLSTDERESEFIGYNEFDED
jgi:hypothetical protein